MQEGKIHTVNRQEKEWYKAIVLVIVWLLIISLSKDVWQIRTGFDRIKEARLRLELEQKKNEALKSKLELVTTDAFKEKIIREKLNMQKEGEVLAVMPEGSQAQEPAGETTSVPIWKKWWDLLSM